MSIDPTNISSAQDIMEYLEIQNEPTYLNLKPSSFLSTLFNKTSEIWDQKVYPHYTNHDTKHSMRIINTFKDFEPLYEWTNYEKIIFVAASLIHDIGMQYNEWKIDPTKFIADKYIFFRKAKYSEKEIRDAHELIMFELIWAQVEKKFDAIKFPPVLFDVNNEGEREAINMASYVAACHRGKKFLNLFVESGERGTYSQTTRDGDDFRPRLLAGTLRLCDELDGSIERFDNINKINLIADESKKHWLACAFVKGVEVRVHGLGLHNSGADLILTWQVPREINSQDHIKEKLRIKHFVEEERMNKISNEISRIQKFYVDCNEHHHFRKFKVKLHNTEPNDSVLDLGFDYFDIIPKLGYPMPGEKTIDDSQSEHSLESGQVLKSNSIETRNLLHVQLELLDWYERNKSVIHTVLVNGEHTNIFLQLRSLTMNQKLLRLISDYLYRLHRARKIDTVMGIGTSAIPIAVNVAYRLNCAATFTFIPKYSGGNIDEGSFEHNPSLKPEDNILIIDDVISGGRVARKIITQIEKNYDISKNVFYHQAIFRLGDRELQSNPDITDYFQIVHIPDVIYAPDELNCPQCQDGGEPWYEIDG